MSEKNKHFDKSKHRDIEIERTDLPGYKRIVFGPAKVAGDAVGGEKRRVFMPVGKDKGKKPIHPDRRPHPDAVRARDRQILTKQNTYSVPENYSGVKYPKDWEKVIAEMGLDSASIQHPPQPEPYVRIKGRFRNNRKTKS